MTTDITRYGIGPRMSEAVAHNGTLYLAGQLGVRLFTRNDFTPSADAAAYLVHVRQALAALVRQALEEGGLPADAVQLVQTTDREAVGQLITMPQFVDVVIPRGGKGLIERISRDAKVPVIKHLDGNCHTYVDDPCDIAMAVKVADNAKTNKYSPCNATESLLVHVAQAGAFLPRIGAIFAAKGVEMRV